MIAHFSQKISKSCEDAGILLPQNIVHGNADDREHSAFKIFAQASVFREEVAVGKDVRLIGAGLRGFEKIGDAVRRGAQRVIIFFQPSDRDSF